MAKQTNHKPDPFEAAASGEAWEWLQENAGQYAEATAAYVAAGKTPEQVFYKVLDVIGSHRRALAMRCKLAAVWLVGEKG